MRGDDGLLLCLVVVHDDCNNKKYGHLSPEHKINVPNDNDRRMRHHCSGVVWEGISQQTK